MAKKSPHYAPKKVFRPYVSPVASLADIIKDKVKAIYPGTLWCGDGNLARSEHEVGLFKNTDICCKMHDKCPVSIPSGRQYKGLHNVGSYTRSHCSCDQQFYHCLKKTNSLISNKIGYTYFNLLKPKCFRKGFPVVGCRKWYANRKTMIEPFEFEFQFSFINRSDKKCRVFAVDGEQTPQLQWFDNPFY